MLHERVDLLFPTTFQKLQPSTETISTVQMQCYGQRTNPSDFIINVQEPMNFLMTNPPKTVLISGIPLCLA